MSRTTKNVIMVFTVVCVVVLVVFCVELFLLNRDNGDRPDTTISNNEPEAPPVDDDPQIADDPLQNAPPDEPDPDELAPTEDTDQPDDSITPPPDSQRYILLLSADTAELIFYVQMEYFEQETLGDGNGWLFTYLPGEDAWLEISFVLVDPRGGARELAQTFLNNYLDGDYSTFEGERNIANSTVRGIFVTGENEGETYDAWLRDLADLGENSIALIVVVRYSTDEEREALYNILDTMRIHMLVVEDTEENGEDV